MIKKIGRPGFGGRGAPAKKGIPMDSVSLPKGSVSVKGGFSRKIYDHQGSAGQAGIEAT